MEKVQVNADNGSYEILIGKNILNDSYLKAFTNYVVVTDEIVYGYIRNVFRMGNSLFSRRVKRPKVWKTLSIFMIG